MFSLMRRPELGLMILLLVIGFIYWQSLPGFWLFDDYPNLESLKSVKDASSLAWFVISGESGPLGRPLSLLTFALQGDDWPDHPGAMLGVNIIIHVVSTLVVYFLALGLARFRLAKVDGRSKWIALFTASMWGLSPFLATTHLMIIQRMTSLAGLFTFCGLCAFVWAHDSRRSSPQVRKILLALFVFASALAILSKENGVLTPLLALVIYYLWIPRYERMGRFGAHKLVVYLAVVPSLIVMVSLAYLAVSVVTHGYGGGRDFTPYQRLLSEVVILIDYVINLVVPRAIRVNPFMDNIPAAVGFLEPPSVMMSFMAWMVAIYYFIRVRYRSPCLLFGLMFFLVGHLIESTFIGLELFFAHRNYVPSFGVYFAISFLVIVSLSCYSRSLVLASTVLLVSMFGLVLSQVVNNWREVGITAERWLEYNPHSQRGAQFVASLYFTLGHRQEALKVLDMALRRNPGLPMIILQRTLVCEDGDEEFDGRFYSSLALLNKIDYSPSVASQLSNIANGDPSIFCSKLTRDHLVLMVDALLANAKYIVSPNARGHLMVARGYALAENGDLAGAAESFLESYRDYPQLETAFVAMSLLANTGQYDRAFNFLAELQSQEPDNPIKRAIWWRRVLMFKSILESSQIIDAAKL